MRHDNLVKKNQISDQQISHGRRSRLAATQKRTSGAAICQLIYRKLRIIKIN